MSNLLCCNCLAIYGDTAVGSPTCPYCNVSHYEETAQHSRPPERQNYKVYPQATEAIDDRWLPYYILQNLVEDVPEIDLKAAHQVGLRLVGRELDRVPFAKILAGLEASAIKRRWSKEMSYDDEYADLSNSVEADYNLIVSERVAELRQMWNNRRSEKYVCTLDEMLDFNKRIATRAGELNKYHALRGKLSNFRKRFNYKRQNVTISAAKENK